MTRTYVDQRTKVETHEEYTERLARQDAQNQADNAAARAHWRAQIEADRQARNATTEAAALEIANRGIAEYKAQCRDAFPGTREEFERAWPRLLQEWQIERTRESEVEQHAALIRSGRYSGF